MQSRGEAFTVLEPDRLTTPLVFNSPHSGRSYPDAFLASSRLDAATLRRSEDTFVELLFDRVLEFGAPLMHAHFPRAFLDVNREPYELDPRMFEGRLPPFANTRSMRVAGGLGTIARIVGDALEIYARRLPVDEAISRIETFYKPYHRALRRLVTRSQRAFGLAILVDCHSMPSASLAQEPRPRADVVLGDRYGASCSPLVTERVERALREAGLVVTRNRPYAGGFITEHYGNPLIGAHAIQIEINRALYMDERSLEPTPGLSPLRDALFAAFSGVSQISAVELPVHRAAAE